MAAVAGPDGPAPTMAPMEIDELNQLYTWVLWAAFAVAAAFGFIAQRTHFCTMGAISDIVNMGDWTRMRMWGMAVGVAMIGFYGMAAMGWIDPTQTIYTSGRVLWLSALSGGALFGFGMVLASGCGSKTLVRIGAGSLKSLVVFFVMGFAAFATLRGVLAVWRDSTVDQVAFDLAAGGAVPFWLSSGLGLNPAFAGMAAAIVIGGGLIIWALAGTGFRTGNNLLAGLGLGAVIVAMWWVSGHLGFVPEHPETLESMYLASNSRRMESLTFTAPMAYTLDHLLQRHIQGAHIWRGHCGGCGGRRISVFPHRAQFSVGRFSRYARHGPAHGGRCVHGCGWCDGLGVYGRAGHVGAFHVEPVQHDRGFRDRNRCDRGVPFSDVAAGPGVSDLSNESFERRFGGFSLLVV